MLERYFQTRRVQRLRLRVGDDLANLGAFEGDRLWHPVGATDSVCHRPGGFLGLEHEHGEAIAPVVGPSPMAGDEAGGPRRAWHDPLGQFFLRTLRVSDVDLDDYGVHLVPPIGKGESSVGTSSR